MPDRAHYFGTYIRTMRKNDERPLRYIAERAGISTTHLWQIEKGNSEPSLRVAIAIARAFEMKVDDFISEGAYDA